MSAAVSLTPEECDHIERWCATVASHSPFSWPTDGLRYEAHMAFVNHRNRKWAGGSDAEFIAFIRAFVEAARAAWKLRGES